jgi:hypothetical protein
MDKNEYTLLHVVTDYAPSGMEFGEINSNLINFLKNPDRIHIQETSVPSLDTIAIGFVIAQYALASQNKRVVIYGNAAPRRRSQKAQKNNADHGVKYAKLKNGVEIINVDSEFAFGFIKNEIVEFKDINCPNSGSQFRSRDFFPKIVATIINGDYSVLGKDLNINDIPDIPNNLVALTDGFGNVKTTMRQSDLTKMGLKSGDKVNVRLNEVNMSGFISIGGFTVDCGVLAINIGSSGYGDPFIELFLRVHNINEKSASAIFNHPFGGDKFSIKKI